ncbi:HET-domain-containing protein, partial [Mytilinidion resinicola]
MSPRQSQISVPLIRAWLNDCESNHHNTCSRSVLEERQGLPVNLLLIDVEFQAIVEAKSSMRYVALSYVWGQIDCFQTTKSTLESLQSRHGLLRQSSRLPAVIKDALAFVAAMGERYLWVDTLCIVQDDADLKHRDIHQMDVIYSHAILTIVVLSGKDANTNIPGIRPGSRTEWKSKAFGNHQCIPSPLSLQRALEVAPLEQRAWTMQERMLSPRCVYFTNQQVYFQC